jgi:Uncharacterized protein conserved in bacteria (DUF2247)
MSAFAKLRAEWDANWTTILVGWRGLGVLSPWPERWGAFPSLVSAEEVLGYSTERVASSSDAQEQALIVELLSLDLRTEAREVVSKLLQRLSEGEGGDSAIELRKWRLVLLEKVLEDMPSDALYGLLALTEFWQEFGFPSDSPHVVQGRGNALTPSEYFRPETLEHTLARHYAWIERERAALSRAGVE